MSESVSAARAITRAMTTSNGGNSSSCCRSASASKAKGLYATTNYVTTATTTGRLSAGLKGSAARAGGMTQMRLPESLLSRNICSVASDSRNLDQQPAGAKTGGNPEQGLGWAPERSLNKAATTTAAEATRRN